VHHFAGTGKPITEGKGAVQVVDDYQRCRFACYVLKTGGLPGDSNDKRKSK